jgi:hypothetical protein
MMKYLVRSIETIYVHYEQEVVAENEEKAKEIAFSNMKWEKGKEIPNDDGGLIEIEEIKE